MARPRAEYTDRGFRGGGEHEHGFDPATATATLAEMVESADELADDVFGASEDVLGRYWQRDEAARALLASHEVAGLGEVK